MTIDELSLYWLAGVLEGDGSFLEGKVYNDYKPLIMCTMTDEDVIARIASLLEVGYHAAHHTDKRAIERGWKQPYATKVSGERAVRLMKQLRPLMGQRRQSEIDRAVASYQGDRRKVVTPEQIEEIRERIHNGESPLKLAKEYKISKSLAYMIKDGYEHRRV